MIRLRPIDIFAFCFALLLALGSWVLLAPKLTQLMSLRAQAEATKEQAALPVPATQSTDQLARFQQDADRSGLLLPATDGQYDLVTKVEEAVRGAGLPLSGLGVVKVDKPANLPVAASPDMKGLDLSISTTGSYADIQRIVARLESLDRLISVTAVTLTGGGQATGASRQVTAQIAATAYYLPN